MLTEEEKNANREEFISLLQLVKEERQDTDIDNLIRYLDNKGFFDSPASTQYHCSFPGGMCLHSLNVYYSLVDLVNRFAKDEYSKGTLIIVGLLHELSKVGYYELYNKNVKNEETGKWEQLQMYRVVDANNRHTFGSLGFNAYMIISNFIPLTVDESVVIVNQYCGMDNDSSSKDLCTIMSKFPLTILLHSADLISTYMIEKE